MWDTWKCLGAPCSRQTVRLGVSQPGLELHPCWIILCATLVFCLVCIALPDPRCQTAWRHSAKRSSSQWCITAVYSRAWLWAVLSISISEELTSVTQWSSKLPWRKRDILLRFFFLFHLVLLNIYLSGIVRCPDIKWYNPSWVFTVFIFYMVFLIQKCSSCTYNEQ